jgi:hypothetical protein
MGVLDGDGLRGDEHLLRHVERYVANSAIPSGKYATPSFAGVWRNCCSGVATTMSQATTRLQAAPHTEPSTAAITGIGSFGIPASSSSTGFSHVEGSTTPTATSLMSCPAEKTRTPGSARITATRASAAAVSSAARNSRIICSFRELSFSERRKVMVAMVASTTQVTSGIRES